MRGTVLSLQSSSVRALDERIPNAEPVKERRDEYNYYQTYSQYKSTIYYVSLCHSQCFVCVLFSLLSVSVFASLSLCLFGRFSLRRTLTPFSCRYRIRSAHAYRGEESLLWFARSCSAMFFAIADSELYKREYSRILSTFFFVCLTSSSLSLSCFVTNLLRIGELPDFTGTAG